ncbi:MAG: hypothetical protein JXA42_15745 [Anaerolineales bacterium]|nr:hypothetical protein [Anaerolineales bacterium]
MIPVTLLLIISPIAAAAIVYIFRRLTIVASPVSATAAAAFTLLALAAPQSAEKAILGGRVTGGVQTILGRTLELSTGDQYVLVILGLASVVLFLMAARQQPGGVFFPGLLALLGIASAVLATETFVFRIILMEILAGTIAILLQGSRFGSTRGAWRFFLFATLAMPLLLVAGWQIDFQAVNPSQFGLLGPAVLLLTIGFIIYLSAVPFHLWMAPASTDSEPLAQILAFCFMPFLAFSVYANALQQFDWYANSQIPFQWFTFSGGLSVGLGALLAFHVTGFGRYNSSVILIDVGAVLLAMGLANQAGLDAAWDILIFRLIGLFVWSTSLSVIRKQTHSDRIDQAAGLGRRSRLATSLLLLGGLSLAGFPLTPGFPGRWIVLSLIAQDNMSLAILLLLGTVSGVIGVLHIARIMFEPAPETAETPTSGLGKWVDRVILIAVLASAIVLSLFPAPVLALALQLTGSGNIIP